MRDRIIASILIVSQMAMYLPAEPLIAGRRAGEARLEQYLEMAGKEREEGKWEEVSARGLEAAMAEWERHTLYYKETDVEGWKAEKEAAEAAYLAVREKRYIEWFTDRYYEESVLLEKSALRAALKAEAALWEYEKGGEGTRKVAGEDAGDAALQWKGEISDALVETYMAKWEAANGGAYGEIALRLREKGISDAETEGLIAGRGGAYREYVKREYEEVALIEGNALLRVLLYDTESVQKNSEAKAAEVIAAAIAQGAKETTEKEAAELFGDLDTLIEGEGTEGVTIEELNTWMEQFRRTFEKGLSEWEGAEEQFLIARSEWEKEAGEIYINSEQVWADAYAQLKGERKAWEREIQGKLDEGIARWRGESEALEAMLTDARSEFESAAAEERTRIEQNIDIQITLYNQSREMIAAAFEGLNYWYDKWAGKYNGVYSYWKTEPAQQIAGIEKEAGGDEKKGTDYTAESKNTDTRSLRQQLTQWKALYVQSIRKEYAALLLSLRDGKLTLENKITQYKLRIHRYDPFSDGVYSDYLEKQENYTKLLAEAETELAEVIRKIGAMEGAQGVVNALNAGMSAAEFSGALSYLRNAGYVEKVTRDVDDGQDGAAWKAADELVMWLQYIDEYTASADKAVQELFGMSGGIFDAEGAWGYYDELETEFLKAKAVASYWKKELEVAAAVESYSANATSQKEAEDETRANLEAAEAAYRAALSRYEEETGRLSAAYEGIAGANDRIGSAKEALRALQEEVVLKRETYSKAYALEKGVTPDALRGQVAELVLGIFNAWSGADAETKMEEARQAYNEAAFEYANAEQEVRTNEMIKRLVNGDGAAKSLNAMRNIAEAGLTVGEIIGKLNDTSLFPVEYMSLLSMMQAQKEAYGSRTGAEKEVAEQVLKEGWEIIRQYWRDETAKREEALRYIVNGESGIGDAMSAGEIADAKLENWLRAQHEAAKLQITLASPHEDSDIRQMEGLLSEILEGENGTGLSLGKRIDRDNPLMQRLLTEGVPLEGALAGWNAQLYQSYLNGSGIYNEERQRSLEAQYGAYAYRAVNKANSDARGRVRGYITKEQNGMTTEQFMEGLCGDLPLLYSYIAGLEKEGNGLNAAGIEALQNYTSGLLEYAAAYLKARGDSRLAELVSTEPSGETTKLKVQTALEGAYGKLSEYGMWGNKTASLEGIVEILSSAEFEKASEGRDALIEAAAYYIIGDARIGRAALDGCGSAEDVLSVIQGIAEGAASAAWATGFRALSGAVQSAAAEKVLAVWGKNSSAEYEQALEWLELGNSDPGRGAGTYTENGIIKAVLDAEAELAAYRDYKDLEALIEDAESEDIDALKELLTAYEAAITDKAALDGLNEKINSAWVPYYLAGSDALYLYLLSAKGYADIPEALGYLDGEKKATVNSYYRETEAVASYIELLDGDAGTWAAGYRVPGAVGADAALTDAEREAVKEAIGNGSALIRTEGTLGAWRDMLKPSLGTEAQGRLLFALQRDASAKLDAVISSLIAEQTEEAAKARSGYQLAQYALAENTQSSTDWVEKVRAAGTGTLTGYDGERKNKIGEVHNGTAFSVVAVKLASHIDKAAGFFSDGRNSGDLTFTVFGESELAAVLNGTNPYDKVAAARNIDSAIEKLNRTKQALLEADNTKSLEKNAAIQAAAISALLAEETDFAAASAAAKLELDGAIAKYDEGSAAYEEAIAGLQKATDVYNAQADAVQTAFNGAERTKQDKRKAQALYEWASSVYLEGFGQNSDAGYQSPKEKLTEVLYAKARSDAAVEVLAELIEEAANGTLMVKRGEAGSAYEDAIDSYKAKSKDYYTARAIAYEALLETERMKQLVRYAELEDQEKLSKLVTDELAADFKYDAAAFDMIRITKNENGTYSVSLAYTATPPVPNIFDRLMGAALIGSSASNGAALENYFTDGIGKKTEDGGVPFTLVDYEENRKTLAAADALDWLTGIMENGQDYLTQLGLASLYMKIAGEKNGKDWIGLNEYNPLDTVNIATLKTKIHGFDTESAYNNARIEVLISAYQSVMGREGGEGDLAKYILYRDTSLSPMKLEKREQTELEKLALDKVLNSLQSSINSYQNTGDVAAGVAIGATAAAIIALASLFGSGAATGLFAVAAASGLIALDNHIKARDLRDLRGLIEGVRNGKAIEKSGIDETKKSDYDQWAEARSDLETKRAILVLYYGRKPAGELDYGTFSASMKALLDGAGGVVNNDEARTKYTYQVFKDSGAEAHADSTLDAMARMNVYFAQIENGAKAVLNAAYEVPRDRTQNEAIQNFTDAAERELVIPDAVKQELRALALAAGNIDLSVAERKKAGNEYDALAARYTGGASTAALKTELRSYAATAYGERSWFQRRHDLLMRDIYAEQLADSRAALAKYSRSEEEYIGATLRGLKETLLVSLEHAQEAQRQAKQSEWDMVLKGFNTQMQEWNSQMAVVLRKSNEEWTKAEERINGEYFAWKENFAKTYAERDAEWRENYITFLEDKDDWMTEQYLYAANYANYGILKESGADVTSVIAQSLNTALGKSNVSLKDQGFDADGYIDGLLGETKIASLMNFAGTLNDRIAGSAGVVKLGTKRTSNAASLLAAHTAVEAISRDRRAVASRLAATQAQAQIEAMKKSYRERLIAENKGQKDWETSLVRNNGYTVNGNIISRRMVVGSTLINNVFETQSVHMYRNFETADAEITIQLDQAVLDGVDDYGIMLLVAEAQKQMQDWSEDIFGRVNEKGYTMNLDIPRSLAEAGAAEYAAAALPTDAKENRKTRRDQLNIKKGELTAKLFTSTNSFAGTRKINPDVQKELDAVNAELAALDEKNFAGMRDGKLGRHIGYEPVFRDEPDADESRSSNVEKNGIGEMGKIMLDFQWNEIRAGKGMSELAAPSYDKRIWDDTGSWLKAPTLRSITEIANTIAATVVQGVLTATGVGAALAPIVGFAINMSDDLLFAGMDIGGGYKTAGEVGDALAKKALTSAISSAMGMIPGGGLAGAAAGTAKDVVIQAGIAMAKSYATSVTNNAVNSFNFATGEMDWDNALKGTYSAGTIAGMLGAGVTAGLGAVNLQDGNGITLNGRTFDTKSIQTMNGLAGGVVSSAYTFAATGNATFNVASIQGVGLFEVNIGKDGFSSKIGMGGTNISLQTLMATVSGYNESKKVVNAKKTDTGMATLNAVNMLGYTDNAFNQDLASDIWNDKKKVEFRDMGENILGTHEGDDTIVISNLLLGGGKEGAGQLASMLSHENAHIVGFDEVQSRIAGYDTYKQLESMFEITGAGYDDITDIAYMTEVYKQYGEAGVFLALAQTTVFDEANKGNDFYFGKVVDPGSKQNIYENIGKILGNNMTQEQVKEYNLQSALSKAFNEQKTEGESDYDTFINSLSTEDKDNLAKNYTGADKEKIYDIYGWGCTLATAAYMAYSITGQMNSLKDANDKVMKLTDGTGFGAKDGVIQNYAAAVNALAGGEVVTWDSSYTGSVIAEKIFAKQAESDLYFAHMRVDGYFGNNAGHSVLFNNLRYENIPGQGNIVTGVNVVDPWQWNASQSQTNKGAIGRPVYGISEIDRIDFYKATTDGRILYGLTQSSKWKGDSYTR